MITEGNIITGSEMNMDHHLITNSSPQKQTYTYIIHFLFDVIIFHDIIFSYNIRCFLNMSYESYT